MSKGLIGFLWHETLKPLRQISKSVWFNTGYCERYHFGLPQGVGVKITFTPNQNSTD